MHIFNYPHYQSEATQFIDQLKASRPELEGQQRQGRNLLWDKNVDAKAWEGFKAAQVDQQPYVYQTQGK